MVNDAVGVSQLFVCVGFGGFTQEVRQAVVHGELLTQLFEGLLWGHPRRRPPPHDAHRPDRPVKGAGLFTGAVRTEVEGMLRGEDDLLMV